jgi:DNA invertase Pin-like site-specific DNA recombinase
VGYIRISKQKEKGVSLEAQAEKIRAMAIVHDAEVEIVADDGETGKNTNRSGLERVLDMVRRREVDLVIVAKLDRLTRSVKDLADLLDLFQRRGVSLISVRVTAWIQRDTYSEVRKRLFDEDEEFSVLVERLLRDWLGKPPRKPRG